jgi:hypothetical protein
MVFSLKNKIYLLSSSSMTFIDKATNEIHEYIQTKNNHEVQIHTCSQLSDLWLNLENRSSESFILFKVNPSMDIISLRNMISCSSSIPVYIINIEPVSSPYRMKSYEYSHLKYPLYASENVKKKEIFS